MEPDREPLTGIILSLPVDIRARECPLPGAGGLETREIPRLRGWFRGRVRAWRPAVGRGCAGGMVWGCRERPGEGSIRIFRAGGMP